MKLPNKNRTIFNLLKFNNFRFETGRYKNFIIVGDKEESERVVSVLRQTSINPGFIGLVNVLSGNNKGNGFIGNINQIKEIIREVGNSDFFSFENDYGFESKNCSSISTDSPTVTLTINLDGKEKTIKHYYGCEVNKWFSRENALQPLFDLENKIDEIVGTKQWIGK